jgi:hypothetical protein
VEIFQRSVAKAVSGHRFREAFPDHFIILGLREVVWVNFGPNPGEAS